MSAIKNFLQDLEESYQDLYDYEQFHNLGTLLDEEEIVELSQTEPIKL